MIEDLLSRLDGVKKTGRDSWMAKCCAHDDKSPSMTIREMPDGRILIHCFAGCSVVEILSSIGLDFDALFPEPPVEFAKSERVPFNPRDVLRALSHEATIVYLASSHLQKGEPLTKADHARLITAVGRINVAMEAANV